MKHRRDSSCYSQQRAFARTHQNEHYGDSKNTQNTGVLHNSVGYGLPAAGSADMGAHLLGAPGAAAARHEDGYVVPVDLSRNG